MKLYLTTCKNSSEEKLLLRLQHRQHFVENSDRFSLQGRFVASHNPRNPALTSRKLDCGSMFRFLSFDAGFSRRSKRHFGAGTSNNPRRLRPTHLLGLSLVPRQGLRLRTVSVGSSDIPLRQRRRRLSALLQRLSSFVLSEVRRRVWKMRPHRRKAEAKILGPGRPR